MTKPGDDMATGSRKAKRTVLTVFGALHTVAFALWFGGVIAIGALVAPVVAHVLHNPPPQLNPDVLKSTLTTGIIGETLRHFTVLCYICGALMVICSLAEASVVPGGIAKSLTVVRAAIAVALIATAFYLGGVLTPHMDAVLAVRNMALFDDLHKQYENIVILVQTPLLLAIPILTAIRDARIGITD